MQRTLALAGVAMVVATSVGLVLATERLPRGWKFGALWSGARRRLKAFVRPAQQSPEGIEWPAPS